MLFAAGSCTASQPGCETIWNIDVQQVYSNFMAGMMSTNQLQSFCRFYS